MSALHTTQFKKPFADIKQPSKAWYSKSIFIMHHKKPSGDGEKLIKLRTLEIKKKSQMTNFLYFQNIFKRNNKKESNIKINMNRDLK